jgi:hypothetical protein
LDTNCQAPNHDKKPIKKDTMQEARSGNKGSKWLYKYSSWHFTFMLKAILHTLSTKTQSYLPWEEG